jgi:predicted transcriptional regulator
MKTILVKDVMVPVSEYATVSKDATLYDAVLALEKAQEEFDQNRYRHRAILVYDENGKIMGKISQTAALRALEPKYEQFEMPRSRYPFAPNFMKSLFNQYDLWNRPLDDICKKAGQKRVKEFVESFDEGEIVQEETSLNEAIHMLVVGQLQSLLVMREAEVSGILRLTDVFHEVFKMVKACEL